MRGEPERIRGKVPLLGRKGGTVLRRISKSDVPGSHGLLAIIAVVCLVLGGCATAPKDDEAAMAAYREANDPIEPFNRGVWEVNLALDKVLFKPVAGAYREVVPQEGRDSVHNFLGNLRTPVILANDLMQGEFTRAGETLIRFATNTTFGFLGIFDPADELGIPGHDEDFGQTLAVWGFDEGPFLMLPLFGPSNPRDGVGRLVDFLLDPFTWWARNSDTGAAVGWARFGVTAIDARARVYEEFNELERTSLDFYAAIRSLYRQKRRDEIHNGVPTAIPTAPTISTQPDPDASKVSQAN